LIPAQRQTDSQKIEAVQKTAERII